MPGQDDNARSFSDLFWSHDGYLSDKWEQYLPIYSAEIGSLIANGEPINLLEIGIQNGGSLEIWSKYLPPGSRIIGVDIDPACEKLTFPENVEFILGDACNQATFDRLPIREFDVIIDDGSHKPRDIIETFALLIDSLKPGGKYIIEDMETSYDPEYGGGFRHPSSTVEWAKGFIDALNIYSVSREEAERWPDVESLRKFGRELWGLNFHGALMVFTKNAIVKNQPYRRVMSGRTAPVMDPIEWLYNLPAQSLQNLLMNEQCHKRISGALVEEANSLRARQREIAALLAKLSDITSEE